MTSIAKGYADTRYGQVHYRRVDGPGPPLVFLHRTPMPSVSFEPVLELLGGERGGIAFDTPGFGQSFSPQGQPVAEDYAVWFLAALDAMGVGDFHLFGHHTGTHFAVEMALRAPASVRSLTLSGVLYANTEERTRSRAGVRAPALIESDGRYMARTWDVIRGLYGAFEPELVHTEVVSALAARRGLPQAFAAIHGQDFPAALARVRCPVRICQAVDDPLTPLLDRARADFPDIPIDLHGPAEMAAPERQPRAILDILLPFARLHDVKPVHHKEKSMSDRRIQLVRSTEGLQLKEVASERPQPGAGDVLIRVRAASLNRRDLMIRGGSYGAGGPDGFTPLSDAAGDVVAVGEGVTTVKVGDRVASTFFENFPEGRFTREAGKSALGAGGRGVLAEHIVLSAGGVAPLPDDWSYEEGASLPCAAVTAWSGLVTRGGIRKDDWVLLIGTGGVSLFGLQIAVAYGAKAVVLSSSDEKLARAEALGAALTINYRTTPDWAPVVQEKTGGVNQVLELGGVGTLAKSMASLAPGGHAALIGALDGFGGEISATGMIMGCQAVSAISVGSRADQLAVTQFLHDHNARPVIDSRFTLDNVSAAYDRLEAGAFGKVIITL